MMLFQTMILELVRWKGENSVWGSESSVKREGRKRNMSILTFPAYFCFQEPCIFMWLAVENFDSFSWKLWKYQGEANSVSALISGGNRSGILY